MLPVDPADIEWVFGYTIGGYCVRSAIQYVDDPNLSTEIYLALYESNLERVGRKPWIPDRDILNGVRFHELFLTESVGIRNPQGTIADERRAAGRGPGKRCCIGAK